MHGKCPCLATQLLIVVCKLEAGFELLCWRKLLIRKCVYPNTLALSTDFTVFPWFSGFTLDKESNTIAILCQDVTVVLAFDTRERLIQWQVKIANHLGEGNFNYNISKKQQQTSLHPSLLKTFHVSSTNPHTDHTEKPLQTFHKTVRNCWKGRLFISWFICF